MLTNLPRMNDPQAITLLALKEANDKHPPVFNSTHEGYAILKEELEECFDELSLLQREMHILWNMVKEDSPWDVFSDQLNTMQANAFRLITEATHTSAMVMKLHAFVRTQIEKKENEDM